MPLPPSSSGAYKNIGIASAIMMTSVFLSRVIGLARESVIAYAGGIGAEVGAYHVAFVIPEILNHILASGFLSVTFIPIFAGYLVADREEEGWRVFSLILTGFGSLLLGLIALSILLAPQLVALCAPGMSEPRLFAQAVRLTRIILPAQFFFFVGGMLMAVQFAKESFLMPALAPLIYNGGIIAGGLLLGGRLGMEGFAWGVLGGAFGGNLAVQIFGARRVGMKYRPLVDWRHPDLKKYVLLTLPLMLGLTMTFSVEFLFRFFGSFLPAGNIAVLNFGLRVMLILVGIFGQAVGTASYPYLARLAAEKGTAAMNALLNTTLRYLALVIPFAVLLMVLRMEVVHLLFQRGRFDASATLITGNVLTFFLAGAFAYSAYTMVVRAFFATQNTLFPAVFGTAAVLLSLPVYFLGLKLWGVYGIALAVSFSGILQVVLLFVFWNRRSHNDDSGRVYLTYFRFMLLSCALGAALCGFKRLAFGPFSDASAAMNLMIALIVGGVFLAVVVGLGHAFRIREITEPLHRLLARR